MNAKELKERHPEQFERKYRRWVSDGMLYDWRDGVYDCFVADCEQQGITVNPERIYFSLGYCQSDYATFDATVELPEWMDKQGYSAKYYALRLDMQEFGARATTSSSRGNGVAYMNIDYYPGQTNPTGVFSDLPQEAWDELCEEQFKAEDWEQLTLEHIKSLECDLYRRLRDEYEYLTSEEQFIEYCETNDVTFDEGEEE